LPRQVLGKLVEQLVEHLDEACVGIDKEGRVQFANPAASALLGLRPGGARGEKIWDVSSVPDFTRAFSRLVKESGVTRREQVIVLPDQRAFLAQMFAVRGPEGRLSGAVAVLRDMTSLNKIEQDMTSFVSRMSQELKKPLTSVKGYVETLLEGAYTDPAICRRFLQVINDETNRMARLLVGLLDASGAAPAPMEKKPISVAAVMRGAADRLSPFALQKNIQLDVHADDRLPPVMGDEAQLGQAITNLLDNALKFTGLVEDGPRRVTMRAEMANGRLLVKIEDTGVGIPPDEQAKVFERFYRVTHGPAAVLGGTGLGLSIATDIVRAMDGTIDVASAPGRGSTFTVNLPV